jgi:hypothetical protein
MTNTKIRTILLTLAALFAATGAWAVTGDSFEIKVYPVAKATSAPVIDGDLGDAAWSRAPVVDEFAIYSKPDLVDPQTHFRVIYTDSDLMLGIHFDEPNMEKLTPVGQPRDSMSVFHGETVEIFVDPDHDQREYFQFAINAAESIYDSQKTDPTWSADVRASVEMYDDHWTMEVALPWADLGVSPEPGMLVGLNVCRDRYLGANKQWSNWARTSGGFHDPERFGHIVLSPSASRLGELTEEFREGGRTGPIVVYGPDGFVQAAYRTIAATGIDEVEQLLTRLDEMKQGEADAGARKELGERIEAYREEMSGFERSAAGGGLSAEQWREMNHRIAQMRMELTTVIWQARLAALISGI